MTKLFVVLLFSTLNAFSQNQGQLQFFQTNWGNTQSWDAFCDRTKQSGYDGIEVWMPPEEKSREELKAALTKYDLAVGFLNGTDKSIPFEQSLKKYTDNLRYIITWKPVYINGHAGSDFFTMDQNKAFIIAANKLGKENNIPVYHETHRGRFSYNLPDTELYLEAIPNLKLTLDISHWMVVHESLLENQDENISEVINRTNHIHARVGHAEGPQVNDPEAPEWEKALDRHLDIWEQIIRLKWKENQKPFTITTEFGPAGYLPTLPYTKVPVADQWKANVFIMNTLKKRMNIN